MSYRKSICLNYFESLRYNLKINSGMTYLISYYKNEIYR